MRPTLDVARRALTRHFGYPDFRPGQVEVVAAVLSGADTLGVLPTGGGKSLCFQVPALVANGTTVVISPLISLMQDQVDRLVSLGIAATFLNSTLTAAETARRLAAIRSGVVKLLYVAPERFGDARLLQALAGRLAFLAVDEAHCISEWGHEFRPSFRRIGENAVRFPGLQIVALTATATPAVRSDIVRQLRMRAARVIVGGFDRPNLSYAVRRCRDGADKRRALRALLQTAAGPAVVYASTRADVTRVARELNRARIPAAPYHGGMPHRHRLDAQDAFMRERVRAIVATSAFGMGVDKPNVRLVVHHAMPGTLEAYYQEAGRAGRDRHPARCVLLYNSDDRRTHDFFIRATFPDAEVLRRVLGILVATADGLRVATDPAAISRHTGCPAPEVEASLRWLERERLLRRSTGSATVHVRLMALPARIASELRPASVERRALRALWKRAGERLLDGIMLEPPLPPFAVLRALRARQFLDVGTEADALYLASSSTLIEPEALERLARRRTTERAKLDRMIAYAETTGCRRAMVLAYFGERQPLASCGGCDNCQKTG